MLLRILSIGIMVLGLPWAGATLAGHDLSDLLTFPPPLVVPTDYLRFSWLAAGAVVAALALVFRGWFSGKTRRGSDFAKASTDTAGSAPYQVSGGQHRDRFRFPWWAWAALVWVVVWWVLAWTRLPGWEWARRYSFFPLWLGFIVAVNGIAEARSGSCLMRRAPGRWGGLFALSAVFWWGFEWLNRFAQNWHYVGAESFSPVAYAVHATLCFSTVLPAVAAVAEALGTGSRRPAWFARGPTWPWLAGRRTGWLLLAGGALGLIGTGAWPGVFYPALWVAPIALYLGQGILAGTPTFARDVAVGDWRRAGTWMVAALLCGFCWELWNFLSFPKWIYTVPGVERWHVFEMPLLGYAGYLPFGLECLAVASCCGVPAAQGERTKD
jgi:hypothetical protein